MHMYTDRRHICTTGVTEGWFAFMKCVVDFTLLQVSMTRESLDSQINIRVIHGQLANGGKTMTGQLRRTLQKYAPHLRALDAGAMAC